MEQKHIIAKRREREKKLERVSLYWEWEEREPGEAHINWEQWQKLRVLRKEILKKRKIYKDTEPVKPQFSGMTSFGVLIEKYNNSYSSQEEFDKYICRLNCEYQNLNKHSTRELLDYYRNRWSYYNWRFNGEDFLPQSFKYVLDNREHVPRKSKKKTVKERLKHQGKKDKRVGRKNPTNRR